MSSLFLTVSGLSSSLWYNDPPHEGQADLSDTLSTAELYILPHLLHISLFASLFTTSSLSISILMTESILKPSSFISSERPSACGSVRGNPSSMNPSLHLGDLRTSPM